MPPPVGTVEREQAGRIAGARAHVIENFGAQAVDRRLRASLFMHVPIEGFDESGKKGLQRGPVAVDLASLDACVELLGIPEIGIDEAGEDHAPEETPLGKRSEPCHRTAQQKSGNSPVAIRR